MENKKILSTFAALLLFGTLRCVKTEQNPANPECKGMQALASKLNSMPSAAFRGLLDLSCSPLKYCSGVNCNGKGYSFILLVEHCSKPIRMLMHLTIPGSSVDEWRVFESGKTTQILRDFHFAIFKVSISLKPFIAKHGNDIIINSSLCIDTTVLNRCFQIQNTSFTVSSNSCTGESPVTPKTRTTKIPMAQSTKKLEHTTEAGGTSKKGSTESSTKMKPITRQKPTPSARGESTAKEISVKTQKSKSGIQRPTESHDGKTKKHKQGHKEGLSTGAKVAIGTSAILMAFLVIALFMYWRKLKKRSPAYYNDILTNRDTGIQGFDDEEPLFDSHLVL